MGQDRTVQRSENRVECHRRRCRWGQCRRQQRGERQLVADVHCTWLLQGPQAVHDHVPHCWQHAVRWQRAQLLREVPPERCVRHLASGGVHRRASLLHLPLAGWLGAAGIVTRSRYGDVMGACVQTGARARSELGQGRRDRHSSIIVDAPASYHRPAATVPPLPALRCFRPPVATRHSSSDMALLATINDADRECDLLNSSRPCMQWRHSSCRQAAPPPALHHRSSFKRQGLHFSS